ncbi:MAG TPA: hypothetical protein PKA27_16610 [Fimbriimonadaceae bacterium]|nr:hypothetical protein [Fimbriimonadaceae bacterium]
MRQAVLEGLTGTERLAAYLASCGILPKPLKALGMLRNLGIAGVGGPGALPGSAAEFANTMAAMCCDEHFRPTEGSPFDRHDLRRAAFAICGPFTLEKMTALQARKLLGPYPFPTTFDQLWKGRKKLLRVVLSSIESCRQVRASDLEGRGFGIHVHSGTKETVDVTVQLASHFRTDKDGGQRAATGTFLRSYNLLKGTKFERFEIDGEDEECDVRIPGIGDMQIVKAVMESFEHLAKTAKYEMRGDLAQAFSKLIEPINKKTERYPPAVKEKLILLLDGGYPPLPWELVKSFANVHRSDLAASGFREIWYASVPENVAGRLYPFDERSWPSKRSFEEATATVRYDESESLVQHIFQRTPETPLGWKIFRRTCEQKSSNGKVVLAPADPSWFLRFAQNPDANGPLKEDASQDDELP